MAEEALNFAADGCNLCILGQAGTGKSRLMSICYEKLSQNRVVKLTASTGIAALRLVPSGSPSTLHSFLGLRDGRYCSRKELEAVLLASPPGLVRDIIATDALIINEVSMLSAALFQQADWACRIAKRIEKPFGAMQVIVCGDFYQLGPIGNERYGDEGKYAFKSSIWPLLNFKTVQLNKVYRQDDQFFIKCIHQIYRGNFSQSVQQLVQQMQHRPAPPPSKCSVLCALNSEVDAYNLRRLHSLPGKAANFISKDSGNRKGRVGKWEAWNHSVTVTVLFDGDESTRVISMFAFTNDKGCMHQLPLKLAWAQTVHRAQGSTINGPVHIMASNMVRPGQLGVALSRATNANYVSIEGKVTLPPLLGDIEEFYSFPESTLPNSTPVLMKEGPTEIPQIYSDEDKGNCRREIWDCLSSFKENSTF